MKVEWAANDIGPNAENCNCSYLNTATTYIDLKQRPYLNHLTNSRTYFNKLLIILFIIIFLLDYYYTQRRRNSMSQNY